MRRDLQNMNNLVLLKDSGTQLHCVYTVCKSWTLWNQLFLLILLEVIYSEKTITMNKIVKLMVKYKQSVCGDVKVDFREGTLR